MKIIKGFNFETFYFISDLAGTRTLDLLIKSQ